MYAVIATGGKQYRVTEGQKVKVEKLEAEVGCDIHFPALLMANGDKIEVGTPMTAGKVSATVIEHGRGEKIEIIKFRRRKHHRKQMGHRQAYTEVQITKIAAA